MPPRSRNLRALPAVETLLQLPALTRALERLPRPLVVEAARAEIAAERGRLRGGGAPAAAPAMAAAAAARAEAAQRPLLRRVINATGVVLHTNLGRAPLGQAARRAVAEVARGYCSVEFDVASGRRGDRGAGVERWLTRLTGAEAGLVVNNGAAAVLLALSALAAGRKVVVSRGELVEIGGSFRIPEILEKSGAGLVEVGTTNRTHLRDFERALARHGREVAAVLRVHPSNFRVSGFTTRPTLEELARLTRRRRIPLLEDLGSGALTDLGTLGVEREPTVRESLTAGCDLVTFSGDKLLGATQAGLILGRRRLVERLRRDPLARALRVDKLTLAALEATLPAYGDPIQAAREVPALAMLGLTAEMLEPRARSLAEAIRRRMPEMVVTVAGWPRPSRRSPP
ncbi:MAG: L-seryl-tRNA(Sec) selenium transferase [Candidatus Eisenbacteria bacterium]|uniref:L-seryl-tRNA(Sec) selenium transferase n=1 Tax=Eiseniibacteriota bacterium TaxID=2212470 RepID=A0A538U471_UNCEI|nr:MAG: L-seryl-tRNA(Sec) selenium transferase [Candidatus Eisenbacteria bacterium]